MSEELEALKNQVQEKRDYASRLREEKRRFDNRSSDDSLSRQEREGAARRAQAWQQVISNMTPEWKVLEDRLKELEQSEAANNDE